MDLLSLGKELYAFGILKSWDEFAASTVNSGALVYGVANGPVAQVMNYANVQMTREQIQNSLCFFEDSSCVFQEDPCDSQVFLRFDASQCSL